MRLTKGLDKLSVKNMIHRELSGFVKARGFKRIHASDVTKEDYCPREVALMDTLKRTLDDEFIGTALQITFQHGEDNNKLVADRWLRDYVVGDWVCLCCKRVQEFTKYPKVCPNCGKSMLEYQEVRFTSEKTGVSCGIDILLDMNTGLLVPVELKTIDRNKFKDPDPKKMKELIAPLAEHKLRTSLYLRSIAESDHPHKHKINTDMAFILYRSKGHGVKDTSIRAAGIKDDAISPFKEFVVHRDDSLTESVVRKAWAVKESREGNGVPEGVCNTAFCPKATSCKVVKECFSGTYPASITWRKK